MNESQKAVNMDHLQDLAQKVKAQNYQTGAEVEAAIETKIAEIGEVDLSGYVQKDGDKVLSDNNYSTAEKEKLGGITDGATKVEASVNAGKIKINGTETTVVEMATDAEVAAMLKTVFGS